MSKKLGKIRKSALTVRI